MSEKSKTIDDDYDIKIEVKVSLSRNEYKIDGVVFNAVEEVPIGISGFGLHVIGNSIKMVYEKCHAIKTGGLSTVPWEQWSFESLACRGQRPMFTDRDTMFVHVIQDAALMLKEEIGKNRRM